MKDHLSQAGIECTTLIDEVAVADALSSASSARCMNAGLPVRPTTFELQPMFIDSREGQGSRGGSL